MILVRHEADDDLHLVLSDGQRTMIAEAPAASSLAERHLSGGLRWRASSSRGPCLLAGAGYRCGVLRLFPGQTGVAPNALELHPILAFHCLTGRSDSLVDPGKGCAACCLNRLGVWIMIWRF